MSNIITLSQEEAHQLLFKVRDILKVFNPDPHDYDEHGIAARFIFFELYESIMLKKDYVDAIGLVYELYRRVDILSSNVLPILCKTLDLLGEGYNEQT